MIEWRPLEERDLAELRDFTCLDLPSRDDDGELVLTPEQFAELEAQTGVREAIQFPLPSDERCIVGVDDEGIVAVRWWMQHGGPHRIKMLVGAVAQRARGTGVGDLMMEEFFGQLLDDAAGRNVACIVGYGLVRPANSKCAQMLSRHKFYYVQDNGEFHEWGFRLDT